jgi:predicted Zn-dependent peptidase
MTDTGQLIRALALAACAACPVAGAVATNALEPATRVLPDSETFLPAGALDYQETRLGNGLRIISQTSRSAPYVSLRLVIRTGTDDFPCRDRELPHLVEHLLFSANSGLDENEIDDAVTSWGGNINAYTYGDQTDVVLDVNARYQADAIRLLAAMIRDFAPEDADVAREADVVERESGIEQTAFRLWWSALPATRSAMDAYWVDAGIACGDGIAPVHHLGSGDVRSAFATAYVPGNMTLIVVGDLSADALAVAQQAFAALPAGATPPRKTQSLRIPDGSDYTSGWLSGVANLDLPVAVGMMPFRDWQGYYVMLLAESWLNDRMYRDLRSQRGIAYTPAASLDYHHSMLSMTLWAETESADTGFATGYLNELTARVRREGISEEDFEHLRRASLLGMAQSLETIASRADYLASSMREIDNGGLFQMETFYRDLDYATFRRLLARDWPERFAVMDNAPPLSWSMRMALLGGSLLLLLAGIGVQLWRRLRDARPG